MLDVLVTLTNPYRSALMVATREGQEGLMRYVEGPWPDLGELWQLSSSDVGMTELQRGGMRVTVELVVPFEPIAGRRERVMLLAHEMASAMGTRSLGRLKPSARRTPRRIR